MDGVVKIKTKFSMANIIIEQIIPISKRFANIKKLPLIGDFSMITFL